MRYCRSPIAMALTVASWACLGAWQGYASAPNILLIVSDDQGVQMGAMGTPGLSTPNMDSIAAQGMLFNKAYVPHPTCSVSRASIMTGTMPHTHGTLVNVNEHFGPDPSGNSWFSNPSSPYNQNQIDPSLPTIVEMLDNNGYRTAVTSKLHQSPHHRYPFDVWIDGEIDGVDVASSQNTTLQQFMVDSDNAGSPFFAMVNLRSPHRPLGNFQENSQPDPDPNLIEIPASFPDTQVIRDDWIQYLKAVQRTDDKVGEALQALSNSGLENDTVVIFMGDHGPAYHNAKWTPYNFGLHVPMVVKGPGIQQGVATNELASSIDLMPTLLEMAGIAPPPVQQGRSLKGLLEGSENTLDRDYVVGELIHPSGLQERSVHEERYHLIHRSNVSGNRIVPADNRVLVPWGNPVYQEVIDQQALFPAAYQQLTEIHNGALGGTPQTLEFYDLQNDPWEVNNLAADPNYAPHINRLQVALQVWAVETNDSATQLYSLTAPPVTSNAPASASDDFNGLSGDLGANANWTTQYFGSEGADFTLTSDLVDAPPGSRVLATLDGLERGSIDDFTISVDKRFNGTGVGGGLVFGYVDDDNFFEFQLLDGRSSPGGINKDLRLIQVLDGVQSVLLFDNSLTNYAGGWWNLEAHYTSQTQTLELTILDNLGQTYFNDSVVMTSPLAEDSQFGISTWSSGTSQFDNFSADLVAGGFPLQLNLLGDFNGDGMLSTADIDTLMASYGDSSPAVAELNIATPDDSIDRNDLLEWLQVLLPIVSGFESALGDTNLDGRVDALDLATWEQNYGNGSGMLWSDGDFDGDGDVDGKDFLTLQSNLGFVSSLSPPTVSTVPEPSTTCIAVLLATMICSSRRRK